ncbi:MAG: prolipoprotein diacylglyceryl transferase [Clostridia bacterium]|nr:prolipoprotein diacylglyceryl transferase [Clostridia bacterium]
MRWKLYVLSFVVGFVFLLLITVLRRKAYNVNLIRAVIYSFITFLSGFCGALLIAVIYNLLASLKGVTAALLVDVLGAVVFTSLFLLAAVSCEKAVLKRRFLKAQAENRPEPELWPVSFRDTMDLLIPGAFVVFAFIKIGCAFRGCCFGFECGWGLETPFYYHKTMFPVQLFESASLFIIAAAGHFVQKASFYRRGMSGPFAAFLYGMARFFWEFFRWNPPEMKRFFIGLTIWQLFCLLIFAVAGAWIYILFKTQPPEPVKYKVSGGDKNNRSSGKANKIKKKEKRK